MRILLVPHTGLKKIHGDSNYLLFLDLARYLTKQGHFCYMVMPRYAQPDVERMPGLMYVYKDYEYDFYTEYGLVDLRDMASLFSRVVGKYYIDAMVLAAATQVPIYKLCLSDPIHQKDVPAIVIEPGVEPMKENQIRGRMTYVMHALGYSNSTTIFLSPHEKMLGLDYVKKTLGPAHVKTVDKTAKVMSIGVPCDYIDKHTQGIEKHDKFTMFFGARLNGVKQPEKIFELFGKFIASGKEAQAKISSNTTDVKFSTYNAGYSAFLKRKDVIEISFGTPRSEYLKLAKASHVAICWSKGEGFPVGFWEQMYMGLPVLFKREKWVEAQVPEWYPWVFNNEAEAYTMLTYIYENYDQVVKDMEKMQTYIRETYSDNTIYSGIEDAIDSMVADCDQYRTFKSMEDLIKQVTTLLEPGTKISVMDMLKYLNKAGRAFPVDQMQRISNAKLPKDYDIYKLMIRAGYVDDGQTAKPQMIVPKLEGGSK